MNEQNSDASPVEPGASFYKDRSSGLAIFGVMTAILGCLAGLFVLLMLVGQSMTAARSSTPPPNFSVLPAVSIYGFLAIALIWLGIGSIMARRWARALLLIFSWTWLLVGLIALIMMGFIMPAMRANIAANAPPGQPAMPPGAMTGVMVLMFLFMGVIFVVLPAVWVFFYRSPHVKATCEARDPLPRWTDACPLPVLGLCLLMAAGTPMMLIMPLTGHYVMPFFGTFLTGAASTLLCFIFAALEAYAAWSMYKLKPAGWWLILIAVCLLAVSGFLTFMRHDMTEMYQLMGYTEAQMDQLRKTGLLTGNKMTVWMSVWIAPFLGYLFYIKKYFTAKS